MSWLPDDNDALSSFPAGVRGRLCRVGLRVQLLPRREQALQSGSWRNIRVYSRGQGLPVLLGAGGYSPSCLLCAPWGAVRTTCPEEPLMPPVTGAFEMFVFRLSPGSEQLR